MHTKKEIESDGGREREREREREPGELERTHYHYSWQPVLITALYTRPSTTRGNTSTNTTHVKMAQLTLVWQEVHIIITWLQLTNFSPIRITTTYLKGQSEKNYIKCVKPELALTVRKIFLRPKFMISWRLLSNHYKWKLPLRINILMSL